MVRISERARNLLLHLSLAGMSNDELLQVYGSMDEDMGEERQLSFSPTFGSKRLANKVRSLLDEDVSKRREVIENRGIYALVVGDDFYPEKLALSPNPPVVMYAIGNLELMARPSISVVGARKHTSYGAKMCKKFVGELAERGLVIVSGLALGIDKLAHQAALEAAGDTIAVLGNGIGECYPKSNRDIYERIVERGLVLSEYPPFTPPKPFRFPERNRIIAALGDGTLVVEAKERSGSLITARLAAECGREVFAICGNLDSVYSKGTNRLIMDGAQMVLSCDDICQNPVYRLEEKKKERDLTELSLEEKTLYGSIENGNQNTDALVADLGWNITEVLSVLTVLELKNVITGVDSGCIEII
ncbi:MAG: DNA-processing protein DprA [Peptoniphilus sp.]|nr:DNA-processing protein DprA [Peptoniphilus sp.]MDD7363857.1 DNA-processing protein DprA [Bacillota bacterium]MDY6044304.1 DNA-processing protein DprA [Peptoniphilus sp.]